MPLDSQEDYMKYLESMTIVFIAILLSFTSCNVEGGDKNVASNGGDGENGAGNSVINITDISGVTLPVYSGTPLTSIT